MMMMRLTTIARTGRRMKTSVNFHVSPQRFSGCGSSSASAFTVVVDRRPGAVAELEGARRHDFLARNEPVERRRRNRRASRRASRTAGARLCRRRRRGRPRRPSCPRRRRPSRRTTRGRARGPGRPRRRALRQDDRHVREHARGGASPRLFGTARAELDRAGHRVDLGIDRIDDAVAPGSPSPSMTTARACRATRSSGAAAGSVKSTYTESVASST
jgi:hypothetical protein